MFDYDSLPPLLPKLYDLLITKGYKDSYQSFIIQLLQIVLDNKQFLHYENDSLLFKFNVLEEYEQLRHIVDKLKQAQSLESELEVYQNEELTLLQVHLQTLQPFLIKHHVKLPNSIPNSFSEAHNYLIPISSLLQ